MIRLQITFLVVLISILFCIRETLQFSSEPICFNKICPAGTENCKKHVKSTADKRRLKVEVTCLDEFDASLKDYHFEDESQVDIYTNYERSSYEPVGGGSHQIKRFDLGDVY